ncbi:MAG: MBL fold metallo-hydrolase [Planctomycetota bacterium]|nr:MBL fold metallo-hydrolase [Planctomycetota bacterium]MDA1165962.1 MBL fold metallo-hydrolase [Planctomycetota bacterium]
MRLTRCLFAGLAVVAAASSFALAGQQDGRLDVYFIDVEGGAATLFVTPAGESLLIDSGYPGYDFRDRDRIVDVAKNHAQIKQIDHALVSHWHLDHYGNHAALTEKIRIGNFWDRGIPATLEEDKNFEERIVAYRAASQNQSKTIKAGDSLPLKSGSTSLAMKVVTASREVIENVGEANPFAKLHETQPVDRSDNAASISLMTSFGRFRFLCCGDLTWNIEAKLVTPNNSLGQVDVFMVTHHGLPNSNNPALVLAIDPVVAIMCNGPTKGGHEQTQQTLRKVKSLKDLYQLHQNVNLAADQQAPAEFIANVGKLGECAGVFVKMSVAADGDSYTVQIGADGKVREYQCRK